MNKLFASALCAAVFLFVAGCASDESKIEGVKTTVIPECKGKTMQDLAASLLEQPVWGLEKSENGKESVTVKGTLYGDKLPAWVKQQKMVNLTLTFPLDNETSKYDPSQLDGFPSFAPEGLLKLQRIVICQ